MAGFVDWGQKKKLEDAARHWAGGGVIDEAANDLAAFGASPEIIRAAQEISPSRDFEIWPENEAVVSLFMMLQTQWISKLTSKGLIYIGLNYQSVEFILKIEGIKDQREAFHELRIMEAAALHILNSKG